MSIFCTESSKAIVPLKRWIFPKDVLFFVAERPDFPDICALHQDVVHAIPECFKFPLRLGSDKGVDVYVGYAKRDGESRYLCSTLAKKSFAFSLFEPAVRTQLPLVYQRLFGLVSPFSH